ncbi:MAG: glutamyl-tRNA reductase [Pseudomonadales bacterium]
MTLFALGINHKTASVDVRERVAFTPAVMERALVEACEAAQLSEIGILSTCNRTEFYYCAEREQDDKVLQWVAEFQGISHAELNQSIYHYAEHDAVVHMMRVACGLDSLILGEPQILGQLKSCYAVSQKLALMKGELGQLFERSFAVAKQVRTDTAIGENPVSVAFAAVSLAQHIFSDLASSRALLIGAGETIELVARHLRKAGVQDITVANRTLDRAQALAESFDADAILLGDIPEVLHRADIVIASTASQLPILGKGAVESALQKRRHEPMFMIDIAVPRDIEAEVKELDDVYLYSVDDLQQVISENQRHREVAAKEAEKLIVDGAHKFAEMQRARDAASTLTKIRGQAEQLRDEEVVNALKNLAKGSDAEQVVRELARRLSNKMLHHPTIQLRKASAQGRDDIVQLAEQLYQVDSE